MAFRTGPAADFVFFLGVTALTRLAFAQAPSAAPALTPASGTISVPLVVTVVDARKWPVPGLVKDDFEVLDNGKPRPLVWFDHVLRGWR